MEFLGSCKTCSKETYYQCVKCFLPVCNRLECSKPVPPTTVGYNENNPKRVASCDKCGSEKPASSAKVLSMETKKTQSSISSFFVTKPRYLYNFSPHSVVCNCVSQFYFIFHR